MNNANIQLTGSEFAALRIAFASSAGNGHDFGFVEDIVKGLRPGGINAQAVGALVTSLSKKGVFRVYEPVTTDSGRFTQFVFKITAEQVEALLRA